MNIVCDTNILVSGILFGGHPRQVLRWASQGLVTNAISPAMLREAGEVLQRPRFGLREVQVAAILALFRETFEIVEPVRRLRIVVADPSDDRILETAEAAGAEFVVSGDHHLLELNTWQGIRILAPARFIAEVSPRIGGGSWRR